MKYLHLIRIKHWIKNVLIFIPLLFSGLLQINNLIICFGGFISFSLLASAIYIINDLKDLENDRLHPIKKNRPLPSGKVKKNIAIVIAFFLIILSLLLNFLLTKTLFNISFCFLLGYLIINILYSLGLKKIAIIDVVLLASGFVIRVYYGASLINVEVSKWLFLTIMSASLFLGLGKRKKELINAFNARKVLIEYNEAFLDKFQYLTLTLMIVFYSLWAMEQKSDFLIYTVPILMVIIMRYSLIVEKSDEGDPTTILYSDKILFIMCALYGIILILIYFNL